MKRRKLLSTGCNIFLKPLLVIFIVLYVLGFSLIIDSAEMPPEDRAKQMQAANADLDMLAQEIAKLCSSPGFREFLRSNISKSKNRENIIELDKFLDRALEQAQMPPELDKVKDAVMRVKKNSLQPFSYGGRLDLYLPVKDHNKKWSGGDDLLIAPQPVVDDESTIKQMVAYHVGDGKRVTLDPKTPPKTPVFVLAPCEHKTHEVPTFQPKIGPIDRPLPEIKFVGEDAPDKPMQQDPGNSWLGIYRIYIHDVMEGWGRGAPEIKVFFGHRVGYTCQITENGTCHYPCSSGGGIITHYIEWDSLEYVDQPDTWYYVWYPGTTTYCNGSTTNTTWHHQPCYKYNSSYGNRVLIRIYEEDGPYCNKIDTIYCEDDVYCSFQHDDSDQLIAKGSIYINNFPYWTLYGHYMGNAVVQWVKVP